MSLFATDITTGLPVFSDILLKLYTMFLEIVRAVYIPNTEIVFNPEIFVSVVAQGTHPNPIVVLVQGFKLSAQKLPALLKILEKRLRDLEEKVVGIASLLPSTLPFLKMVSVMQVSSFNIILYI